jgi:hypothetical protein
MLSETIHVAYPDILKLGEDVNAAELTTSLAEAAEKATAIDILGGYYSVDRTLDILKKVPRAKRGSCKIRLAVGLDANSKIRQHWTDMRSLAENLKKAGFKDVTLAIVSGRRHFHSKLFHFLRATHHVWFVGSANPGSDRHELMVSFTGRHDALKDYVDAVFAVAQPVTKQFPPNQFPGSLREFFLTGSLIHRTPQQTLFTFDAFRLDPEDREKMMRSLTAGVVPHARPKTQGFAFGLRSAVETPDFAEDDGDEIARVHLRMYSIDTALGLWAPRFYIEQIRAQLQHSQASRTTELRRFSEQLSGDGTTRVKAAFADYIGSMERLLESIGITPRPVERRDAAFERFVASRQRMLATEDGIERLAQRLEIIDMPDIWYDPKAVDTFEMSAFSDLAYRISGTSRFVRAVAKGLNLPKQAYLEPEALKEKLEKRLSKQAWKDSEWEVE